VLYGCGNVSVGEGLDVAEGWCGCRVVRVGLAVRHVITGCARGRGDADGEAHDGLPRMPACMCRCAFEIARIACLIA
jgi:hypothetical protein